MADFRHVTDELSVAPQISIADVAEAAKLGFRALICNRPDAEEPGQPPVGDIAQAAKAQGLAFHHIPVRGQPTPDQVEAMRQAVAETDGPVLAFCRSGTRSIVTWSLGQAASGERARGELISLGREAGYDLSGPLGG
jgi:uncharacterized protein (TIGR01244 family)